MVYIWQNCLGQLLNAPSAIKSVTYLVICIAMVSKIPTFCRSLSTTISALLLYIRSASITTVKPTKLSNRYSLNSLFCCHKCCLAVSFVVNFSHYNFTDFKQMLPMSLYLTILHHKFWHHSHVILFGSPTGSECSKKTVITFLLQGWKIWLKFVPDWHQIRSIFNFFRRSLSTKLLKTELISSLIYLVW